MDCIEEFKEGDIVYVLIDTSNIEVRSLGFVNYLATFIAYNTLSNLGHKWDLKYPYCIKNLYSSKQREYTTYSETVVMKIRHATQDEINEYILDRQFYIGFYEQHKYNLQDLTI